MWTRKAVIYHLLDTDPRFRDPVNGDALHKRAQSFLANNISIETVGRRRRDWVREGGVVR